MTIPTSSRRPRAFAATAALLACLALVLTACGSSSSTKTASSSARTSASDSGSGSGSTSAATSPSSTAPSKPKVIINVNSVIADGSTYGVGMPIILRFSKEPANSHAFTKAVTVTVNGQPAGGYWYWEKSGDPSYAVEAHYRPRSYWPGNATIKVNLPIGGLSAGGDMAYSGALNSITWHTGTPYVGAVDGSTSKLTITNKSTGAVEGVYPVALGAPNTPTLLGTKVIMYKGRNERMIGSGYDEIVPWSMRLTNSGEYLHAASWNIANIDAGRPSSNGCTNMLPADAMKLFNLLQIGTPVTYTNVPGNGVHTMPSWDGYGDWNVAWGEWEQGGLLINRSE